jgi:hypothetical protein
MRQPGLLKGQHARDQRFKAIGPSLNHFDLMTPHGKPYRSRQPHVAGPEDHGPCHLNLCLQSNWRRLLAS